MTNTSDLDGDGQEEQIEIQSDVDTGDMSVLVFMNDKAVNLFGLVSEEFIDEVNQMTGGDDCKEILLAVGNDNGALVVSLLKYTDGEFLYRLMTRLSIMLNTNTMEGLLL